MTSAMQPSTPTPLPAGGRRRRTSRIKNSPQQSLENITADIAVAAELLTTNLVDPAAIEPETVRRLTVTLRTAANIAKKYAHQLEQHHAHNKNTLSPAVAAASGTEGEQEHPTIKKGAQ